MFHKFNDPEFGATYQDVLKQKGLFHTSMSVGDVIKFPDDTYFLVKGFGWEKF